MVDHNLEIPRPVVFGVKCLTGIPYLEAADNISAPYLSILNLSVCLFFVTNKCQNG